MYRVRALGDLIELVLVIGRAAGGGETRHSCYATNADKYSSKVFCSAVMNTALTLVRDAVHRHTNLMPSSSSSLPATDCQSDNDALVELIASFTPKEEVDKVVHRALAAGCEHWIQQLPFHVLRALFDATAPPDDDDDDEDEESLGIDADDKVFDNNDSDDGNSTDSCTTAEEEDRRVLWGSYLVHLAFPSKPYTKTTDPISASLLEMASLRVLRPAVTHRIDGTPLTERQIQRREEERRVASFTSPEDLKKFRRPIEPGITFAELNSYYYDKEITAHATAIGIKKVARLRKSQLCRAIISHLNSTGSTSSPSTSSVTPLPIIEMNGGDANKTRGDSPPPQQKKRGRATNSSSGSSSSGRERKGNKVSQK